MALQNDFRTFTPIECGVEVAFCWKIGLEVSKMGYVGSAAVNRRNQLIQRLESYFRTVNKLFKQYRIQRRIQRLPEYNQTARQADHGKDRAQRQAEI